MFNVDFPHNFKHYLGIKFNIAIIFLSKYKCDFIKDKEVKEERKCN